MAQARRMRAMQQPIIYTTATAGPGYPQSGQVIFQPSVISAYQVNQGIPTTNNGAIYNMGTPSNNFYQGSALMQPTPLAQEAFGSRTIPGQVIQPPPPAYEQPQPTKTQRF